MKHVLILGGGVMQVPAIKAAKKMGWRVSMADGNPGCFARDLVDRFFPVDLRDHEGLLAVAGTVKPGLDGVFTAGTDFSTSVAYVTENLGLPGTSYEAALNATDKVRMRKVLNNNAIPIPKFAGVGPRVVDTVVVDRAKSIGYPLVVKPVDNMGARGVRRLDNDLDLHAAIRAARQLSRSGDVVLEQFVAGPEFSVDALVFDGEVHITGVANRHIFFPPFFVEMGHTIPAEESEEELEGMLSLFRRAVLVLGISHGAAKGDLFLSPSGPVIGEIAARLSGGYMSGWTYPYSSGVQLSRIALQLAVGIRPKKSEFRRRKRTVSAERALVSVPGRVAEVKNFARGLPGITDVFVGARPGDLVDLPRNNVEKVANVISRAGTRKEAEDLALRALGRVHVNLEIGNTKTESYLFKDGMLSVFRPYDLRDTEVAGLSPFRGNLAEIQRVILEAGVLPVTDRSDEVVQRYPAAAAKEVFAGFLADGKIRQGREEGSALDGMFWRAFVSGGRQGGQYVVDSLIGSDFRSGTMECLQRWLEYFR